jgi:hypothetical protein
MAVPRLGIARLQYDGGGDWYANPSSLPNLLKAINERTSLRVEPTEGRVTLTDDRLYDFSFLHVTGHGVIKFSDAEISRLREWLLRGGFLHVDDNYGLDETFRSEIARVFPDRPMIDVPLTHPIYNIVYSFPRGVPKVHEHDGKRPQGFGIFHEGRLVVFYTYEADIGDGIEDAHVHNDPAPVREQAMKMAVNVVVYAMTS